MLAAAPLQVAGNARAGCLWTGLGLALVACSTAGGEPKRMLIERICA